MGLHRANPRPLVVLASLLALASMGSEYRGCSQVAVPEDEVVLPSSSAGCLFDADCTGDPCSRLACRAGACVQAGVLVDRDGDGHSPPPCGTDCNDLDATVFPGAAERCDGRDEDCDEIVDEGAPGVRTQRLSDDLTGGQIVGLDDGFAVLGIDDSGQLAAYVLTSDGFQHARSVLAGSPESPVALVSADASGPRVVVAYAELGAAPSWLELERNGDTLDVSRAAEPIAESGETLRLDVHVFGGASWVAFDIAEGGDARRWLFGASSGSLVPLAVGESGPFLSNDGRNLVVTSGEQALEFLGSDGAFVATRMLPGAFASGRSITRGDGAVVAAYRDSFDHNLTTVTSSSVRSPITAPFGMRSESVAIHRLPEGVLVTRATLGELRAWILSPDLRTYLATFSGRELSPFVLSPDRVSAATDGRGKSAILGSYPDVGGVASFLACDTAP